MIETLQRLQRCAQTLDRNINTHDSLTIERSLKLGNETLQIIDQTYGTGTPFWLPGTDDKEYHNGYHGLWTGNDAARLTAYEGLDSADQAIANLTGLGHDFYHGPGHEARSARRLDNEMAKRGFTRRQRQLGRYGIYATKAIFTDGVITGQYADRLDYPTKEAEIIGKAVASADMGKAFTPEGPYLAIQLFKETYGDTPEAFEKHMLKFQKRQIQIIHNYTYPLKSAERVLATHRGAVADFTTKIIKKLEAGDIETLEELTAHTLDFMYDPNQTSLA